jgi:hypothetical protein
VGEFSDADPEVAAIGTASKLAVIATERGAGCRSGQGHSEFAPRNPPQKPQGDEDAISRPDGGQIGNLAQRRRSASWQGPSGNGVFVVVEL